mmetsp:Transcript_22431/g.27054  ORF Transcript_22431/g.27054 Transcript_22431/m.27054 type:complete len:81 (+) Transcript_22431:498-740(+)
MKWRGEVEWAPSAHCSNGYNNTNNLPNTTALYPPQARIYQRLQLKLKFECPEYQPPSLDTTSKRTIAIAPPLWTPNPPLP